MVKCAFCNLLSSFGYNYNFSGLNLAKEEMRILKDYKEKIVLKKGKLVKVLEPIYEYIGKGGAKLWKGRQNQK